MEMMEMVSKVVTALKGDKSLLTAFSGDPASIVKKIHALKGAASAAADTAKDAAAGGIIGKIKNLL